MKQKLTKNDSISNKAGTLNFSVTGDFITNFARQRFIETKSRKVGVDILCKCIKGLPENIAIDIVSGRSKLVGTNVLKVESDHVFIEPYGWIKPCNIEKCECGWIAPDGRVFGFCDYDPNSMPHESLAEKIVQRDDCGIIIDDDTIDRPYYLVERAGWVKFSPTMATANCKAFAITDQQQKELVNYMKSHDYVLNLGYKYTVNYITVKRMDTLMLGVLMNVN